MLIVQFFKAHCAWRRLGSGSGQLISPSEAGGESGPGSELSRIRLMRTARFVPGESDLSRLPLSRSRRAPRMLVFRSRIGECKAFERLQQNGRPKCGR